MKCFRGKHVDLLCFRSDLILSKYCLRNFWDLLPQTTDLSYPVSYVKTICFKFYGVYKVHV